MVTIGIGDLPLEQFSILRAALSDSLTKYARTLIVVYFNMLDQSLAPTSTSAGNTALEESFQVNANRPSGRRGDEQHGR